MSRSKRSAEELREAVAAVVAAGLYGRGVLWSRPLVPWYARRSPEVPWETGRNATQLRDYLVTQEVKRMAVQEPYASWRGMRGYFMHQSPAVYDLYQRLRWIWDDWTPPGDLPES